MGIKRSEEFKRMLAEEYLNSTISIKELSKKYGTDAAYQLRQFGVKLKGRGVQKSLSRTGCIKYKWVADCICSEEQAYALGFLMADGYNNGKQAGIKVMSADSFVLERIKNCFSEEIKLQKEEKCCSFAISSMIICNNLQKLGIIQHKSYSEKNLPSIPSELMRHFIRGYFDGDGTVFVCNQKGNRFLKCNICSSTQNILIQIQNVLDREGISSSIDMENRKGKAFLVNNSNVSIATMNMFRLFIRRKEAISKLFYYLYDGATIYLERKYKIFVDNADMLIYRHVNTELTK